MPTCEWEPTGEQQRAFYLHVLEGKAQFLGGSRVTYIDGVMKFQDISPQESKERDVAEAL